MSVAIPKLTPVFLRKPWFTKKDLKLSVKSLIAMAGKHQKIKDFVVGTNSSSTPTVKRILSMKREGVIVNIQNMNIPVINPYLKYKFTLA